MRGAVGAVAESWKDYMAEPMPGLPVDQQAALVSELPASLATKLELWGEFTGPSGPREEDVWAPEFSTPTSITAAPNSSVILSSGFAAL